MPQAKMLKKKEANNSAQFLEMAEFLDASLKQAEAGRIVKGMVLEVRPSEVLVDVGGKSEGVVPISEFEDISLVTKGSYVDVDVL
jgi:small subunit ribosomal protein S1